MGVHSFFMLPVCPPALEAPLSRKVAKRKRDSVLPQGFLLVAKLAGSAACAHGFFRFSDVYGFDGKRQDCVQQYLDLIAVGRKPEPSEFVSWTAESCYPFESGPVFLEPCDVKPRGICVGKGFFTDSGLAKVNNAMIKIGSELLNVRVLFEGASLRVFVASEAVIERIIEKKTISVLVTPSSYCAQAGLEHPQPCENSQASSVGGEHVDNVVAADEQAKEEEEDEAGIVRHDFETIIAAVQLSSYLRNHDHMAAAIKCSIGVAIASAAGDLLCDDIDKGIIRIPSRWCVQRSLQKLDCIAVLWERMRSNDQCFRCLPADASQKFYNYFCIRENAIRLFPSFSPQDLVAEGVDGKQYLQKNYETFAWQITVFGHGASDMAHKLKNTAHSLLLKGDNMEAIDKYRCSVIGWSSDQGTERKLADCAFDHPVTRARLREVAESVQGDGLGLGDPISTMCYLWLFCLIMPGHLHIIFNALKEAVLNCGMWGSSFTDGLTSLLYMLNNIGLRQRFVATCMTGAPNSDKAMFDKFSKKHLDWRWESLHKVLQDILPLIPLLIMWWNLEKMSGTADDDIGTIDSAAVKGVDKFLKKEWLEACLEMLRVVSQICNAFAGWLEGCECHEHIWQTTEYFQKAQQLLFEQYGIRQCMWKGCRGDEMGGGAVEQWLSRISHASSDHLTKLLSRIPAANRAGILAVLQNLKEALCESFQQKFAFWIHLPYILLGMLHKHIDIAKNCARKARSEWRSITDKSKIHRVAHRFFADPVIAALIDQFCDTCLPITAFPKLYFLVIQYCFVKLVERAIEGEHAKIEHVLTTSMTPASVCARIRLPHIMSLLDDKVFWSWCKGVWASFVFHRLLQPLGLNLKGLTSNALLHKIYLHGIAEQFQNVGDVRETINLWSGARAHVLHPVLLNYTKVEAFALDWIRHKFIPGRILSLPAALARFIPYVGHAPEVRDAYSIDDVVSLLGCNEVLGEALDVENAIFFKVVNAYPSRRHVEHPWHMGRRPLVLAVARYHVRSCASGIVIESDPHTFYLDLLYLCSNVFPEVLQSAWAFGNIEYGSHLAVKDSALQALEDCPVDLSMPMQVQDEVGDAGDELVVLPPNALDNSKPCHLRLLDTVVQQQASSENDGFVEVCHTSLHTYMWNQVRRSLNFRFAKGALIFFPCRQCVWINVEI